MTVKGLSVREPWGLEKQSFGKPREHGYHLSLNFTVSVDAKYHLFKLILSRILQRSVQKLAFHLLLCAAWFFPQTIAAEIPWIAIDTLEKIAIEKIGEKIDFKSLPACSNLKEDQLFCLRQIQLGLTLESLIENFQKPFRPTKLQSSSCPKRNQLGLLSDVQNLL